MKEQYLKVNVKPKSHKSLTTTTLDTVSEVQVAEICNAICHDNAPHVTGFIPLYKDTFGVWFCSKR